MKIKNIALSAVIVSIASIPTICFANIGDTQEQSDAKYGTPLEKADLEPNIIGKKYKKQGWTIVAGFIDNNCEYMVYFKTDESVPSAEELAQLLRNNIPTTFNVEKTSSGFAVDTDSVKAVYGRDKKYLAIWTPHYDLVHRNNDKKSVQSL